MPDQCPSLYLEAVIQATIALDDALDRSLFPQARHFARVVALRADAAGVPDVADGAHRLRAVLETGIRPAHVEWKNAHEALHRAIDQALEGKPGDQA